MTASDSEAPTPCRIAIEIADDGLTAHARVGPGPQTERARLDEVLRAAGVVAGLDEAALALVAERLGRDSSEEQEKDGDDESEWDEAICIARGRPARNAVSAQLELAEPLGPTAGRLRDDASLDYRERGLIVPVQANDLLGRLVPETPAEDGFDVRGRTLPAQPAKEFVFAHGEGVEQDATGGLRATRRGARTRDKQGLLDVVELHVHAGPVDLASGNLASEGSLSIAKDVKDGMQVRAGADLEVRGTVESARLEAGGSIEIRGGVIGGEKGSVRAGGDVSLRHALGARIEAGGVLRVARSVATSELRAREIEVGGGLLGEAAYAETRICVRDAGSPAGGPCHLRAAHPLEPAPDVVESAATADVARARARARLRAENERLSERKTRAAGAGRGERPHVQPPAELAHQRHFRTRQRELQPIARIEITGTAHAGCRIDFGGRPLVLEESVRGRIYRYDVEADRVLAEEN